MATNTAQTNARQYPMELVHYISFTANWNDTGIASGLGKQYLPAGALVIGTDVFIDTAFNAGTTNVLTVGDTTTWTQIAANASVVAGTLGLKQNIAPNAAPFLTKLVNDTQVGVQYTQTGGAATAGKAYFVVKYVPNIDSFQ